jgi:DNA-binding FrmR family transcriptional regulator
MNGLMAEVMEGHILFHLADAPSDQNRAAQELIEVIDTYLKSRISRKGE